MEQSIAMEMENFKQEKSKPKSLPKLKVFELIQRSFATVGIAPILVDQSYPLNGRILFGFLLLDSGICITVKFIIYEAKTFAEYTQCIYGCSMGAIIIISLLILILKVKKLFEFVSDCDGLVNTSE